MYGIDTKICRETKSTGTISAISAEFPGKSRKTPSPTSKLAPWIKPVESVQPGRGSYADVPIIEGLRITRGIFVLFS